MTDENAAVNGAAPEEAEHKIDPELEAKHKTLTLLTHGAKCTAIQNGKFACSFHHCKAAKTMLQHVANCRLPPGSCPVPFCAMAKYVLANASDIQIQMAKANKRGRDFQRTMLSNHRAMTASVARTRSRSGSRGPPTQRRPLATVYESNDEGEEGEGEEVNVRIRTAPAKSKHSAVKPRISDSSGTADTDSSDEDSSEEEESERAVASKVAATRLRRPYLQPTRKICSPPDKEDSSESSSEDDEGGFGMPGSVIQTQTRATHLASDSSDSDDDEGGFGQPGSVQAQQKSSESEDSDSDDDDGGFGMPGTSSKEEEKKADSNSSNDNDNIIINYTPLKDQADTRVPDVDSDSDSDDDEGGFGLPGSVQSPIEVSQTKKSDSDDDDDDDDGGFSVPDTSSKIEKEEEASSSLNNQNGAIGNTIVKKQPDTRDPDPEVDSDSDGSGVLSSPPTKKEQDDLIELLNVSQVLVDDWSSDEEEELKAALADRNIEIAQKLMMDKEKSNEPTIIPATKDLSDNDADEVFRETDKQAPVSSLAKSIEENSQEDVAYDTSNVIETKKPKEEAKASTASDIVVVDGKDMPCTEDQEAPQEPPPASQLSDQQPQNSGDDDWSSDEDEDLKAALANRDIALAQQLMKKADHVSNDFQETQEDSPPDNKSNEECQLRGPMLDTEAAAASSQDVTMSCQSRDNNGAWASKNRSPGRAGQGRSCWAIGGTRCGASSSLGCRGTSWASIVKEESLDSDAAVTTCVTDEPMHISSNQCVPHEAAQPQFSTKDSNISVEDVSTGAESVAPERTEDVVGERNSSRRQMSSSESTNSWNGANCWATGGSGCKGSSWASIVKEKSQDSDAALTTCVTDVPIHDPSKETVPHKAAQSQHPAQDTNISVEVVSTGAVPVLPERAEDKVGDEISLEIQMPSSEPSNVNSMLLGQYDAIRFKTAMGSLLLFKDCLVFDPNDNTPESQGNKVTLSWMEVSKHQRTPVTHAKALLKLMLTSGKCLAFEFQERGDLFKCRKDITSVLREYRAAADASAVPTESIYEPVRFRSMVGTMTLGKASLVYTPKEDSTGTTTSSGRRFTLKWEDVSKHQVSPATHEKHLLKFLLNTGKALTFELEHRVELVKARREITQLLREHQPSMNTSIHSCASSNEDTVSTNTN